MTYEEFKSEYIEVVKKFVLTKDSVAMERVIELEETYPEWAEQAEDEWYQEALEAFKNS